MGLEGACECDRQLETTGGFWLHFSVRPSLSIYGRFPAVAISSLFT